MRRSIPAASIDCLGTCYRFSPVPGIEKLVNRSELFSYPSVDTVQSYKDVAGKVVQQIESFQERGELGWMGTTISVKFTDDTELNLFVGAHTEVAAEIVPARGPSA